MSRRGEPVQPTSLFRIASVSKAITAVAVLTLVDAGHTRARRYGLSSARLRATAACHDGSPPGHHYGAGPVSPHRRLGQRPRATIRRVSPSAARRRPWSALADPAEAATIVRFMLGEPLDFDPGTRQAYSNFGFNVLGRVIEHVSGSPTRPTCGSMSSPRPGSRRMRLGRTRLADRAPGEVRYYAPPGQALTWSVFWGEGYAPFAYGGSTYWRPSTPMAAGSRALPTSSASRPRWTASGDRPCSCRRRSRPWSRHHAPDRGA